MGSREIDIELCKKFVERGKEDLNSAEVLLKHGFFADSTYHSQQAVEKVCKALLILENKFVSDHIISGIVSKILDKELAKEIIPTLKSLEEHWIKPRYPFIGRKLIWDSLKEKKLLKMP
ncbi:MAG: HEPN domain-containing protein [Candidatus Aenigmatarchaeota archaeon]